MITTTYNLRNSPHLRRLAMIALHVLLIGFLGACSDEVSNDENGPTETGGFSEHTAGTLSVNPGSVDFDLINIGDTDQRTLTLSNTGNGTLNINNIQLIKNGAANSNKFNKIGDWSKRSLKSNESFDLVIEYEPHEDMSDSGVIRIESNSSGSGTVDIPIKTAQRRPEIFTPKTVNFEGVAPGSPESQVITVQNIGFSPLTIRDIVMDGHEAFTISFPSPIKVEDDEEPLPDLETWIQSIEPDDSFPVRITFAPTDRNPATGDLIFATNDPKNPEYVVKVIGNSGTACMDVTDEEGIHFGASHIGRTSNRAITITNCSQASNLEISAIEISDDGGAKFDVPASHLPAGLLDDIISLRPRETANFTVTYDPNDEVEDAGEVLIKSNDPLKTALKIPVTGKGSHAVCPTATAEARLVGSAQYKNELMAQPLQNIEFDGSQSFGTGNLTYEWTILERPSNSQARLTPNNSVDKPKLWLDLAGDYKVELVVYDADGLASCESSFVTIKVVPGQEIHIQLTWYAPTVPNPRYGLGTDVDLHYRHQDGARWNDSQYTVYWGKIASSSRWGSTPTLSNKATLDIDDRWGETTENINHVQPLNGRYEIGVHYYDDNGKGGADVTMRIYVRGQLAYEWLDTRMQHKQFWRVGSLQWPSGELIQIHTIVCDTTLAGFALGGCRS